MKLAELSERSGVATATIKYYLRERLLPAGRRISATQAEYDEDHLRRLRLVRAMIQVGGMTVATAREVLTAVDDETLDHNVRLGAAIWALPHAPLSPADEPATESAKAAADSLLERLGWSYGRELGDLSPAYGALLGAIATMSRLGYPCDVEHLLPFGEAAGRLAGSEMDLIETYETQDGQLEAAVALTVLYEPVLLSLRRLAHQEESNRRFDGGT